jgi:hypothetical protein
MDSTATALGHLAIIVTQVVSVVVLVLHRRWDMADRKRAAVKVAADLTQQLDQQTSELTAKVEESTAASKEAVVVANNFNEKLLTTLQSVEAMNQRVQEQTKQKPGSPR